MARQRNSRHDGWRRFGLLFGIAAISILVVALPRAALACATTCNGPNQFVSGSECFTSNPPNPLSQVPLCSVFGPHSATSLYNHKRGDGDAVPMDDPNPKNDPFVNFTSIRDRGAGVSSASGAVGGQTASAHTTDVRGGETGAYDGWNKTLNLANNQSLVVGGGLTYDSSRTTFGSNPLLPGVANVASDNQSLYRLHGTVAYFIDHAYFGGTLSGDWGHGNQTDNTTGGAGGYGIHGVATSVILGNVFTLYDTRHASSAPLPTKSPPKPSGGGYALQLDLRGHLGYSNDQYNGFTDSSGFIWGTERLHYWDAGGVARLFATIPAGRLTWTPYVAATLNQQFAYKDALNVPAQPGQIADTIFFGSAQTFLGTQVGLYAQDAGGIGVGIRGIYQQSQEFQVFGGQAYFLYVFPE